MHNADVNAKIFSVGANILSNNLYTANSIIKVKPTWK